jgi:formimidoylglutamate deiminase
MTTQLKFQSALVGKDWMDHVVISVSEGGIITAIKTNPSETTDAESDFSDLVALPGMVNVHSHAFQRGFAGLSEFRSASRDSFWTWRDLMYKFVHQLEPDDVLVIAKQLYLEMMAAGYTWVGEFHYLHNQVGGELYQNPSTMSDAIQTAASQTGIGLCHLPVLYQRGGFRNEPLVAGQDRFELSNEQFLNLVNQLNEQWKGIPNTNIGIALHSLRAVSAGSGNAAIQDITNSLGQIPIHIHVAEQTAEVESCLDVHALRPVESLFENFSVDSNWCLIHATHLSDRELDLITNSGAVVGLCPTTEANLGDGYFRTPEFLDAKGLLSIGSDSHCSVDLREELRSLEYSSRMQSRQRAILGTENKSVGRRLYENSSRGGAQAIGVESGEIKVGYRADFTLVDPNEPAIAGATHDRLLDRLIFTNVGNPVAGVVIGGKITRTNTGDFRERLLDSTRDFVSQQKRFLGDR